MFQKNQKQVAQKILKHASANLKQVSKKLKHASKDKKASISTFKN